MAMFHAMVRHYGECNQVMATFKTKKAADKFCREQYLIAQGYNKSYGIIDNQYIIFSNDGEGFYATVYFVQKVGK